MCCPYVDRLLYDWLVMNSMLGVPLKILDVSRCTTNEFWFQEGIPGLGSVGGQYPILSIPVETSSPWRARLDLHNRYTGKKDDNCLCYKDTS
jgi:hypothetical protein